jgi:peptidoglycan/xylan/chitin deacetylase (PgdA/CDA1 family)
VRASAFERKAVRAALIPLGLPTRRRRGDVVILCYHRVGVGSRAIDVSLPAFRRQLEVLAGSGRVRSLDDALASPDGGVVITIDDGYRDFTDHVLPLLSDGGLPALLYLATGLVDDGTRRAGSDDALTWTMLREAAATGLVAFGSHTHGHVDLSARSEADAAAEMRRSKELIEDELGIACRHFAYPWGRVSAAAEGPARTIFDTAALVGWTVNRRGVVDPYRLGRIPIQRSDGSLFFRAKTLGLLDPESPAHRASRAIRRTVSRS